MATMSVLAGASGGHGEVPERRTRRRRGAGALQVPVGHGLDAAASQRDWDRRHRRPAQHEGEACPSSCGDLLYHSRDRWSTSSKCRDVFEIASLIHNWRAGFPARPNLAALLKEWPVIQGFGEPPEALLLNHLFTVDFAMEWGALVNLCRRSHIGDRFKLCFMLGVVAFRAAINMDLVRTLAAFVAVDELKGLESPTYPAYVQFEFNKTPSTECLSRLIKPFYSSHDGSELVESGASHKLQKKLTQRRECTKREPEPPLDRSQLFSRRSGRARILCSRVFRWMTLSSWKFPAP